MSTAASVAVEVDDGTGTFSSVDAGSVTIDRKVGPGQADFTIYDASPADRTLCAPGREVHITLTVGSDVVQFGGYIGRPRVVVSVPNGFNLEVAVNSFNDGASLHPVFISPYDNPPTKYTDMLLDLWAAYWQEVDTTPVAADNRAATDAVDFIYTDLAKATNRVCQQLLGDYVWWVEWTGTGTGKRLNAFKYYYVDVGKTITESDIDPSFELAPTDWDYRDQIYVVGGDGGGPDPSAIPGLNPDYSDLFAVFGAYPSNQTGTRPILIHDSNVTTNAQAYARAAAEYLRRRLTYTVQLGVYDFQLGPSQIVLLDFPTIGLSATSYAVTATHDEYQQGQAKRQVTLVEVPA